MLQAYYSWLKCWKRKFGSLSQYVRCLQWQQALIGCQASLPPPFSHLHPSNMSLQNVLPVLACLCCLAYFKILVGDPPTAVVLCLTVVTSFRLTERSCHYHPYLNLFPNYHTLQKAGCISQKLMCIPKRANRDCLFRCVYSCGKCGAAGCSWGDLCAGRHS